MSSDEEEIKFARGKKLILNSDSEDDFEKEKHMEEQSDMPENQSDESDEEKHIIETKTKLVRIKRIIDSDVESNGEEKDEVKSSTNIGPQLKKSNVFDINDDEKETGDKPPSPTNKANKFNDKDLYDAEDSSDEEAQRWSSPPKSAEKVTNNQKSNLYGDSDLYDAEGSDDENKSPNSKKSNLYGDSDLYDAEGSDDENKSPNSKVNKFNDKDLYDAEGSSDEETRRCRSLPKNKKHVAKKEQRKSAKAAKSEIEEIHRESQRIVRESNVSIPYHRPKQRTLAEFLKRRKSAPVVSLHTSKDKLNQVWKHLEEREKEAVEFYKSESEHSEEEQSQVQNMKTNISQGLETKANVINPSKYIESNLDDVIHILESILSKIVDDDDKHEVLKINCCIETEAEASFEVSKLTSIADESKSDTFSSIFGCTPNKTEELTEGLSVEKTIEVQTNLLPNTDTSTKSQIFYHNLTEPKCFIENTAAKSNYLACVNNLKNNTTARKSDISSIEVTPSQDFELHMSESERFSEDLTSMDIKKVNDSIINEPRKNCVNAEEPSWMKSAIEYDDSVNKNKILSVPKISGSPSEIIDFEDNGSTGVVDLMQRFMKHISLKQKQKRKSSKQISIVSAERDKNGQVSEIKEELVSMIVTEEEEEDPKFAKPGAKLAKLKAQLQAQMGQRREHEWTKKQNDQRFYEEEEFFEGEKSECDAIEENDNESSNSEKEEDEEEEDEEEEEEEDEEEESLNVENKRKKSKNQFVDEEAEVSEDEEDGGDEAEDSVNSFIRRPRNKKPLNRMESDDMFASQDIFNKNQFDEDEDDEPLTIGQDSKDRGDIEDMLENEPQHNNILTQSPAFPLPPLEGRVFDNHMSWGSSPTLTQKEMFSIFKKEEQSQQISPGLDDLLNSRPLPPLTQELMGMCSGQFTSQPIHCSSLENSQEVGVEDNASQDGTWFGDDSQTQNLNTHSSREESKPITQFSLILSDDEDIVEIKRKAKNKRKLDFSDDEEDDQNKEKGNRSDEDEGDSTKSSDEEESVVGVAGRNVDDEEESVVGDTGRNVDDEEESVLGDVGRNVDDVEYDSEENEIPRDGGHFLDKEAELSESEWDSEDEDENGLDLLEQEEADKEKIDHDADKEELGKMHIRRMLVEDTKEVKLLQEMLLEDGDLHSDGNGRQRLFRWSNQDGDDDVKKSLVGDSDEEKAEEDEDEESWRRLRHERETFLREHSKKMDVLEVEEDLLEDDSQLFKLGKAALRKIQSTSQEPKFTPPTDPLTSPDAKQSFYKQAKRGSFLSRGQQVLSRLAQLTGGANSDAPVLKPKNSRNFVFASISPTKDKHEEPQPQMGGKRKRPLLPLPVAKKPCRAPVASKLSKKRSLLEQLAKCET